MVGISALRRRLYQAMKIKEIKLSNGKTVTIKNLPLGKYAELLKAIKKLPKTLQDLETVDNKAIIENLPLIIANSWGDFMDIFTIATPLKKDEIENDIDLDDAVEITLAVIEVNKYKEIYEKVKKALAQPTPVEPIAS